MKQKSKIKKTINFIKALLIASFLVALPLSIVTPIEAEAPETRNNFLPVNHDKEVLTIQDKIMIASIGSEIDMREALDIAHCESRFMERARSGISSATGVYQFLARTWFDYCEGDPKNADDNIKCFFELYPKHKSWWECSRIEGYI